MPRSTQPITVDQFVELVDDGQKADLLDGMICMASPGSRAAAEVNAFLTSLLCLFVQERGLGQIYGPRSAFRLAESYAPEPDFAFVPRERLHLWEGAVFNGVAFDEMENRKIRDFLMVHYENLCKLSLPA